MLAHLRFAASTSRGRRYPEPTHPYRDVFQRDRDRVVHARAFRRLEAKTQVFSPGISDHFRNRLTHTIEVAHISRTVARVLQLNEDLTETLALVHDIGHPPFAHAGEAELNRQMARFGAKFDHNVHALHLVESFEQQYARFPGLNLTFEVREGIVKHSRDLAPDCDPELREYLPASRPPLEAQIIDLADEIAYDAGDMDDGFNSGILSIPEMLESVPRFAELYDTVETQYPGATDREKLQESIRAMTDNLVTGLIEGTATVVSEAGLQTVDDVRSHAVRVAALNSEAAELAASVKRYFRAQLYTSPLLEDDRQESTRKMARLFEYLVENPEGLPSKEWIEHTPVHRAVCDFIAGMTDGYFHRTYREIFR